LVMARGGAPVARRINFSDHAGKAITSRNWMGRERMRTFILSALMIWVSMGVTAYDADAKKSRATTCTVQICTLDPSYMNPNAGPNHNNYSSPQCISNAPSPQAPLITNAMRILQNLPAYTDLCSLKNIFIMNNNPDKTWDSWGLYESPKWHVNYGNGFIAISINDLNLTFSMKQDAILHQFGINIGGHSENQTAEANEPAYGLAYVLAHELGHIIWHKQISDACFNAILESWSMPATLPDWTPFGARFGQHIGSIPYPSALLNATQVDNIYGDGFFTALAASSPEEDFVESYAIATLIAACPNCVFSYNDTINTWQINSTRSSKTLKDKLACGSNSFVNPQP
jgi:hypothetical protein